MEEQEVRTAAGDKESYPGVLISNNGHIDLEGPRNTRDLGGISTQDGRRIKSKRLIRSGALAHASDKDASILTDVYGVRTVIDLRTDQERETRPDPLEFFSDVRFVEISLLNAEILGISRGDEEALKKAMGSIAEDPIGIMVDVYPKMMLDEGSQHGFATFFNELLEEEQGATLWHCSAGKDRVGMTTFLLMTVLGVPRESIIADYLATNRYMETSTQEILSAFAAFNLPGHIRQGIQVLNSADIRFLQAALDGIDAEYGSLDTYLREVLQVDEAKTKELQGKYLLA